MQRQINNSDNKGALLLFLMSPFLAMIVSVRYAKQKWSKNIFLLFCVFFGYTMVVISTGTDGGSDSVRYKNWFIALAKENVSNDNFFELLYSGGESDENSYLDVIQPLVSFIVSRLTDNYHFLFAAFALIYGYFYSRNVWYLLERIKSGQSFLITLFIAAFILICPIWSINGFRFWTAAQIFLYGAIPYLVEGRKRNLLVASLSILAHFTFILPVAVLFFYVFLGNKKMLLFAFFIITSFIQEFNVGNVNTALKSLPAVFQGKVKTYASDENDDEAVIIAQNWYIKYNGLFLKIICYAFVIAFYYRGDAVFRKNRSLLNLFCFTMLFYGFANIANLLPQGVRFYNIGNLLAFFLIIYYIVNYKKTGGRILNQLSLAVVPLLLIIIIVSVRKGMEFLGIFTILGNPIFVPFFEYDMPLINLIK